MPALRSARRNRGGTTMHRHHHNRDSVHTKRHIPTRARGARAVLVRGLVLRRVASMPAVSRSARHPIAAELQLLLHRPIKRQRGTVHGHADGGARAAVDAGAGRGAGADGSGGHDAHRYK